MFFFFFPMGVKVGIKYNKYVEHNFRHNGAFLRVTLKSIIPKFSSIMYLTGHCTEPVERRHFERRADPGNEAVTAFSTGR